MKYSTDQAGNGQSPLNRLPFSLVVRLHKASNRGPGPQDIRTPALSRYRQTPTDTILLPAGEKLKKKMNVPDTAGQISGTTARFHHEQPQPSPLYKQKQPPEINSGAGLLMFVEPRALLRLKRGERRRPWLQWPSWLARRWRRKPFRRRRPNRQEPCGPSRCRRLSGLP